MSYVWIGLLVHVVMLKRQIEPRPMRKSLSALPVLLLAFAIYLAAQASVQTGEGLSLLLTALMGAGVGILQGKFTRVYQANGTWMMAGSIVSLALWLLSVPIRYGVRIGFVQVFGFHVALTGQYAYVPFLFSLAGILLGRALYLIFRYPNEVMGGEAMRRGERMASDGPLHLHR